MRMAWKVPLFKIYWDEDDVKSVSATIRRGMYWAEGPDIKQFEEALAKYIGTKYGVVFNSGTSALHTALLAHGIGPGDEVIVPSFTFIATANAVLYAGGKPVFADIEDETYGLDPADVERRITKKTKAIVPVHYAGGPCKIDELKEIADKRGLLLIEDAAEAFGAKRGGKTVGTFGGSAMLSFCQNKIITTGDGGAVVTDSRDVYEKLKLVRSHGRAETADFFSSTEMMDYIALGFNYRMSSILAALGLSQLAKADKMIAMRRKNADYMNGRLSEVEGITPLVPAKADHHVYQMYAIRVNSGRKTRDGLVKHLESDGIMSKVYFSPTIHLTKFYTGKFGCKRGTLPVTEKASDEMLSLPMYAGMTKDEMDCVCDSVVEFFKGRG